MSKIQAVFLGPNDFEYYSEMPAAPRIGETVELPLDSQDLQSFKCVNVRWKVIDNGWLLVITIEGV